MADSSRTVVLRFGGDVLLAHRYEKGVGRNIETAFKEFGLFHTDHVSMVNLEVPVTTRGTRRTKPFTFRMKPQYLAALTTGGVDIVNIANNHVYDFGSVGLLDTFRNLDSAQLSYVGAGRNIYEAHRPIVKEIRNTRIGFLGYYGGGESPGAGKNSAGVAVREFGPIAEDLRHLRYDLRADYIVVNFHWGTENARVPDATQQKFARDILDAGADAIIGHHPHVLQGIELYKGKVIAYSLGNLVFGGNSRHTYNTGVLEIRLENGMPSFSFIPVRVTRWSAQPATGENAGQIMQMMQKRSAIFHNSIFK